MLRDLLLFVLRLALWPVQRYFERHLVLRLDFGSDPPPPPDYTPVANASKEAAEIGAQLGREQLAEARRQYEQNMAIARPVVDAQLDITRQAAEQGRDYYEYGKIFRPLEQKMLTQAFGGMTARDLVRFGVTGASMHDTLRGLSNMMPRRGSVGGPGAMNQHYDGFFEQIPNGQTSYYEANPQELFGFGALSQGPFKNASVRNTNRTMGQLTPDDWYKGYMSGFPEGWDTGGGAGAAGRPGSAGSGSAGSGSAGSGAGYNGSGGAAGGMYGGANPFGGDLSLTQQSLLKALMDQQERDAITGEMRGNANELYDRAQGYEEDALRDIALYTGGNSGIYNRYGADIENDVGTAVADARVGQTQALNTAARQAMRYGINPAINLAGVSTTQASQLAAAANNTRNNAIANYRNLVGQGIGMKEGTFRTSQAATADSMGRAEAASMGNRNMRIQDDSLDWAKQLDVTGMARGMPGASQGAYGVAVGAGNSAVQNQMAPGQALIGAMGQANNTTMQGRNLAMQGTLGVLNAQTSYANAVGQSGDSFGSLLGGVGGLVGGLAKAGVFGSSDRRLKENIELVGRDERTGLNLYEFGYIDDPDMRRYVGVMADEVIAYDPRAVSFDEHGYARVNYARLGIEFKEVV